MRTFARFAVGFAVPFGVLLLAVCTASPARASGGEEAELDAVHHTSDGNYLDFAPFGLLELPRLFLVRGADGGYSLDGFASSTAAVRSGRYHALAGGHGGGGAEEEAHGAAEHGPEGSAQERSDTDASAPLEGDPHELEVETASGLTVEMDDAGSPYDASLVPVGGGEVVMDLSITRHLAFIFLSIAVVLALFLSQARKYRRGVGRTSAPRGLLQNALEALVIYIRDEVARPNLGAKTDRYLPYLLTVFFFILTANFLGLVPWGTTATANITVTAVLAVFTFVVTQMAGTKDYWMHIFNPPGVPGFVKPLLVPIEILGLFTKPFALAVRLFANMVAGHLVILNLIGLIFIIGGTFGTAAGYGTAIPAVLLTVFVYSLELLVAFIQAYVFTILSALFIGMATAEHEHDHDHSEDHGPTAHDAAVSLSNGQPVHVLHERTVGTEGALV
jgi:F-type H+-transporting ATPase subunit a